MTRDRLDRDCFKLLSVVLEQTSLSLQPLCLMDHRSKIVVVVEDEPVVRLVVITALEDAGFIVIEAEDAAAALVVLHSRAADVHVLFTDINMPGVMDGLGLAHHTQANWPWIGLLMASGRPQPAINYMPTSSRFLPKPYQLDHVVRHVGELAIDRKA